MRNKNLFILAVVVAVVGAYIFFFERHQPTSEEARTRAEKVFPDLDQDAVAGIEIRGLEGRVRLERVDDEWHLREPLDFPADPSKVNSALGSLANLVADRRLAADEVDPREYGLNEPAVEVELRSDEGVIVSLAVGDEMPLGSKRALRLDSGAEILLASGWFVNDLDREVDDWRSREVVDVVADQVAALEVEAGVDHIRAVQINDEWRLLRPLEDVADGDHLGSVISDLNSLRIEEFLDGVVDPAELGLEAPEYEITVIRTDGGEPLRLDLGATREGEGGTDVACRRGESEYFWARDSVRTRLSKAPVLWRSKKVGAFENWDAESLVLDRGGGTVALDRIEGLWRFADGGEANSVEVQDRLSKLGKLEAQDFDLVAPITSEMGRAEVVMRAADDESEPRALKFSFFEPLTEGGRAMVRVSGRDTIMGVDTAEVDKILGDFEALHPEQPQEPAAEPE
jgi:hypothetical protein